MQDKLSRGELMQKYTPEVKRLMKYLPWLKSKAGGSVSSTYSGSGIEGNSITFPVYDGTLMSFVKDVKRSPFIDKNYVYVYSRLHIVTPRDERRTIDTIKLQDMQVLWGILAKYVLGGMTKSSLWAQGVQDGIFLALLLKMKELLEIKEGSRA